MMQGLDVRGEIVDIIAEVLCVSADVVSADGFYLDGDRVDSLDRVEMAIALEETFDIRVDDREFFGMTTVKEIENLVQRSR